MDMKDEYTCMVWSWRVVVSVVVLMMLYRYMYGIGTVLPVWKGRCVTCMEWSLCYTVEWSLWYSMEWTLWYSMEWSL